MSYIVVGWASETWEDNKHRVGISTDVPSESLEPEVAGYFAEGAKRVVVTLQGERSDG